MILDILSAEIGSTTTVLTGFSGIGTKECRIICQSEHFTTVKEGDVTEGINRAIAALEKKFGEKIIWDEFIATSSAAGGLRMSVHGLVYDMTVRAAKEAALGAGAIIKNLTSGKIGFSDLENIKTINPNIILLAGGVDHGEKETVLFNAEYLARSDISCPFIYAGNNAAAEQAQKILSNAGKTVFVAENVFPRVDELNVLPVRRLISEIFSEHIIHAKGMEQISSIVSRPIIPTPAAVMETTGLLYEIFGDSLTIDIGGATTDVDSFTEGNPDFQEMQISPEPLSKRTVEGDLGVYVNAVNVVTSMGQDIEGFFPDFENLLKRITPYPSDDLMERFAAHLAKFCLTNGLRRHCGRTRNLYGPAGRQKIVEGKDLSAVKVLFGTGGILSRSKYSSEILLSSLNLSRIYQSELLPNEKIKIMTDKEYIFAPIGAISLFERESAKKLLLNDLKVVKE